MLSSATGLWKLFRDQAEHCSGIGLKLLGFIAESVFTIIPESCSSSSWHRRHSHSPSVCAPASSAQRPRIRLGGGWF